MAKASPPDFDAVYRDGFSFVYRLLRYFGTREEDVEDLAHDVFVVVHRRLPEYDMNRALHPWLFGITYRVLRRHRERGARRAAIDAKRKDEATPPPSAEQQCRDRQSWQRLCEALRQLPFEQQAVVILHDVEEQSAPEIAAALKVSVNTVYSRLRLARKRLATTLTKAEA